MDLATVGFKVDTTDLEKAVAKLNAIAPAAAGVVTASAQVTAAMQGVTAAAGSSATSIAQFQNLQAQAILKRMQATETASKEDIAAAATMAKKTQSVLDATLAEDKLTKAMNARAASAGKLSFGSVTSTAMGGTRPSGPTLAVNNTPVLPRDQTPNRFNTANIAAQFQDIGVTAAMGMNPLQIALQQGTQLAAIMNSMANPLAGLAAALKQVFNAISLGTIAIIAIVAALIEWVNWIKVAQALLYGLANVIQTIAPYFLGLATILALFYSEAIIAGIGMLTVSLISLGGAALVAGAEMLAAWLMALSPLQLIIVSVVALVLVFQAMGADLLSVVKEVANGLIGAFVGAFNAIKATWKTLPDVMGDLVVQAANSVLSGIESLINGFVSMVNALIDKLPENLRPAGGHIVWTASLQLDNKWAGAAQDAGAKAGKAFADGFKQDYVSKGIAGAKALGDSAAKSIRDYAKTLGQDDGDKKKDPWTELSKGADRTIAKLNAQADAIGMTEQAAAKLKYQTDLLNEAQQKGIDLSPAQRAAIEGYATDMATAEVRTKNLKDALDFAKETTKGFFQDMKTGLQQGKTLWESFGAAVTNVLNKILDKMLNSGVDMLFGGSGGGAGGGGAGIFGSLLGGLLGHGTQSPAAGAMGPTAPGTGLLGLLGFAKGGVFTNSIVSQPTAFKFAQGDAFGVMGEAGPEAVMPLHRGPDGSLGVKMNGAGGGGTEVNVNIINNGDSKVSTQSRKTSNGVELDVMIDNVMSQKISDQSSSTNRSLQARDSRQLISR